MTTHRYKIFIAVAAVAVAIYPLVVPPALVTPVNYIGLYSLVCIGLVLLSGVGRLASVGQAAFVGLGAYTSAYLTVFQGFSPWVTLPISIVAALAVAFLIGKLTVRLAGHYLVLGTIAWGLCFFYLFGNLPGLGGYNGITGVPTAGIGENLSLFNLKTFHYVVWAMVGLTLFGLSNLLDSRVGRAMRSLGVGTMPESFGISIPKFKLALFLVAAGLAACAGWLHAHHLGLVTPGPFGINASVDFLFMSVVGGTGHLLGGVLGPAIVEILRTVLRDAVPRLTGSAGSYELVIFAVLIVILMQRSSGGLMSWLAKYLPTKPPRAVSREGAMLPVRTMPAAGTPLYSIEAVTRKFGGLTAVNAVSFDVKAGEILGIIGPNGAGKSTLFNLVTGVLPVTSGTIKFLGEPVQQLSARHIAARGVARTFQHVLLSGKMTALENTALGAHSRGKSNGLSAVLRLDRAEEDKIFREALLRLEEVGLAQVADMLAANLALGQQRLLEIARALAADPLLLILDEPAAGLRYHEKQALAELLRNLRQKGLTIMIVEHDMEFVMGLVDRLIVMDFGQKIAEGSPQEIQVNPRVIEAYLGPEDESDENAA